MGLNFSAQRILPVICIARKSVRIAPTVTASPVNPLKKNANENEISRGSKKLKPMTAKTMKRVSG